MKRQTKEHGRILSVETKYRGDALVEDALAGATTLIVGDAGDFDEDGGWLTINGQVVEYTECDDDEGTITLAEGLSAAADQGDAVHLWSEFYQEPVDYQEILVELDGEYDNPETVVAELADGLPELPEGDRGRAAESCTLLRVSDDEWEVVNVGGRPKSSAGMQFEADDAYVLTADDITAGTVTFRLSHTPIVESVDASLGIRQRPSNYSVDHDDRTITWPLSGFEESGDTIWVHYAYRHGISTASVFVGSESAASASGASSVTVNVPSGRQAGDVLLLSFARLPASTPAGWTLVESVAYGIGGLTVFSRISDGTETSVTVNAASGTGYLGAQCVAYRTGAVQASDQDLTTGFPTSATYKPRRVVAPIEVAMFLYDGEGTSGSSEEEIAVVAGTSRANVVVADGLFSLATVEGGGSAVTDASPDAIDHDWASVTVGLGGTQ